jgi:hypothetical protein
MTASKWRQGIVSFKLFKHHLFLLNAAKFGLSLLNF